MLWLRTIEFPIAVAVDWFGSGVLVAPLHAWSEGSAAHGLHDGLATTIVGLLVVRMLQEQVACLGANDVLLSLETASNVVVALKKHF